MPRYVAFLRGVSPVNAKNADLKLSFEEAGLANVKTVLSSGNVAFNAYPIFKPGLAQRLDEALTKNIGHTFNTIMRPSRRLRHLVESDPYVDFDLPAGAKRIVTFLAEPHKARLSLPIEAGDGRILAMIASDVFSYYLPTLGGSQVMRLIEKIYGNNVTTRTWETVKKCALA